MIFLDQIEEYFNGICEVGTIAKRAYYLTEEADIKDTLSEIGNEDMPFLMVIIPQYLAKRGSDADNYQDVAKFLCYLMYKENNFDLTTFEIHKELQPQINLLKEDIINSPNCHWLGGLEVDSF